MTSELKLCNWCGAEVPCLDSSCPLNTRAVPDVPELDQYTYYPANFNGDVSKLTDFKGDDVGEGDYVPLPVYLSAIEAKDAEIANLRGILAASNNVINGLQAELAQIKVIVKDANAVHVAMLRGDIAKPTLEQINHIYAAPVLNSLKAENEKRRGDLRKLMSGYVNTLENGMDRIRSLGGSCDDLDTMIANDPYLRDASAALNVEAGK